MQSRSLLIIAAVVISGRANAVFSCGARHQIAAPLFGVGDIFQRSNQTGDDDRRTAARFGAEGQRNMTAEQVEKKYSATGDLLCPDSTGQAQVTVRGDTVTTAGHMIYPNRDCTGERPFKECKFVLKVAGKLQEYRLKEMVKTGWNCPPREGFNADRDDWIVFRLEKYVDKRVKPYGIPTNEKSKLTAGQKVVAVSKSGDWPTEGREPLRLRPRHYGGCTAMAMPAPGSRSIQTDCDTSLGSSGGSLLTNGEDPLLVGVIRGQIMGKKNPNCPDRESTSTIRPYLEGCWANSTVPVAGEFKQAIMEATGLLDDSEDLGSSNSPAASNPPLSHKLLPGLKL